MVVHSIGKYNPEGRTEVPGILLACKHTYVEALQIFFSKSIFLFTNQSRLFGWLKNIGPENRSCVGHVDFRIHFSATRKFRVQVNPLPLAVAAKIKIVESELKRRGVALQRCKICIRLVSPISDAYQLWWKELGSDGIERMMKGKFGVDVDTSQTHF